MYFSPCLFVSVYKGEFAGQFWLNFYKTRILGPPIALFTWKKTGRSALEDKGMSQRLLVLDSHLHGNERHVEYRPFLKGETHCAVATFYITKQLREIHVSTLTNPSNNLREISEMLSTAPSSSRRPTVRWQRSTTGLSNAQWEGGLGETRIHALARPLDISRHFGWMSKS